MIGHDAAADERPILGIQSGNDYFFTIHAGGESNAAGLVNRIYSFMEEIGSDSWIIMGDFHRNSSSLKDEIEESYSAIAPYIATVDLPLKTQITTGGNSYYAVAPIALTADYQAKRLENPFDGEPFQTTHDYPVQFSRRERYEFGLG